MGHEEIKAIAGTVGLVLFVTMFIGIIAWMFRPGSKKIYEKCASIPLKDEE